MKRRIMLIILLISALAALIFVFGGCNSVRMVRSETGEEQQTPGGDDGEGDTGEGEGDISGSATVTITYIDTIDTYAKEERVIERGGQAPYIPDTEDYFFQYWATDDGTEWDFPRPSCRISAFIPSAEKRNFFRWLFTVHPTIRYGKP